METAKQGYWSWEYHEYKDTLTDSNANHNYAQFAKRQYHKARRRHDSDIINEQLADSSYPPEHFRYLVSILIVLL